MPNDSPPHVRAALVAAATAARHPRTLRVLALPRAPRDVHRLRRATVRGNAVERSVSRKRSASFGVSREDTGTSRRRAAYRLTRGIRMTPLKRSSVTAAQPFSPFVGPAAIPRIVAAAPQWTRRGNRRSQAELVALESLMEVAPNSACDFRRSRASTALHRELPPGLPDASSTSRPRLAPLRLGRLPRQVAPVGRHSRAAGRDGRETSTHRGSRRSRRARRPFRSLWRDDAIRTHRPTVRLAPTPQMPRARVRTHPGRGCRPSAASIRFREHVDGVSAVLRGRQRPLRPAAG